MPDSGYFLDLRSHTVVVQILAVNWISHDSCDKKVYVSKYHIMESTLIWALKLAHSAYNLGFTNSNYHLYNSKTEHTVIV